MHRQARPSQAFGQPVFSRWVAAGAVAFVAGLALERFTSWRDTASALLVASFGLSSVGLVETNRAPGRVRAQALAGAAILGVVGWRLISPSLSVPQRVPQPRCQDNLRRLAIGFLLYAEDHDEHLPPPGADWQDSVGPYVKDASAFLCPADSEPPSYGLNPLVRAPGCDPKSLADPARTILLFETDGYCTIAWRHDGGAYFAYVDGHARWQARERHDPLIWEPDD